MLTFFLSLNILRDSGPQTLKPGKGCDLERKGMPVRLYPNPVAACRKGPLRTVMGDGRKWGADETRWAGPQQGHLSFLDRAQHTSHCHWTPLKQHISYGLCSFLIILQPWFILPKNDWVNNGKSQPWPESAATFKMKQTLVSPFFPGLSSISDQFSLLFFLKPSQSHCFLLHWLLLLPICGWLLLFCLPLKCGHSLKFYPWPPFILTLPICQEISLLPWTQLSRICNGCQESVLAPIPLLHSSATYRTAAQTTPPPCSIFNSTGQKLDCLFFPKPCS